MPLKFFLKVTLHNNVYLFIYYISTPQQGHMNTVLLNKDVGIQYEKIK